MKVIRSSQLVIYHDVMILICLGLEEEAISNHGYRHMITSKTVHTIPYDRLISRNQKQPHPSR
jgi:hypothetical protein